MPSSPPTPPSPPLRTRAVAAGHLRAFVAAAEHLNFRAAADTLALTPSAVSRQIQALEDEVGVPLFLRHTRAVELTSAGVHLLRAVAPGLERIDAAVRQLRQTAGRKSVAITTWASFAAMWLIPRLEAFQREFPDIDIRIDTSDTVMDMETTDVDLALRYSHAGQQEMHGIDIRIDTSDTVMDMETTDVDLALRYSRAPESASAERLFGEQLAVVASPWLLRSQPPIRTPADAARFTLIETGDAQRLPQLAWLGWQRWFHAHGCAQLQPPRWLYFNYAHQIVQAALAGQGLAIARLPLVADALASGDLVEVLPAHRLDSPLAYWLLPGPRSAPRPEVQAFCDWLRGQAALTRSAMSATP